MSQVKKYFIVAGALAPLAIIAIIMNSHQATAQNPGQGSAPVSIIGPIPLPVTGSTAVSGTVAATQSGTWNVGIAGNTAANPLLVRDVENPGQHTFEIEAEYNSFGCQSGCTNFASAVATELFDLPAVPTGKRWVITRIAGQIRSTTQIRVSLQSERITAPESLKAVFYGPFFSFDVLQGFNTEVFTSYGSGETPHVNIFNATQDGILSVIVFGGYLIDN